MIQGRLDLSCTYVFIFTRGGKHDYIYCGYLKFCTRIRSRIEHLAVHRVVTSAKHTQPTMQGLKTVSFLCVAFAACLAHAAAIDEPSAPAQYDFSYAVNDPTTGDQKDQQETRNGDDVTGYYRTVDSDGFLRTVRYKADAVNGFTAEVVREPVSGAAAVPVVAKAAPVVAPVIKPAVVPVVAPAVAPVPYVAPVAPYYASYPYNYQPYPYGYQQYPYSAGYTPYSYGQYAYNGQYGFPFVRK
ncbi:cuticle protein 19.8-like [Melanaphis sacchari]|uniref:cuticle protein 19.8-like n=1 Tax=Melanaphis sacchari TaxID=742174 RepID=UPI000DC15442|nr:cuticle protein 19.8-like [Melanaphis sacchari]